MKKFFLSLFVICASAGYAFYQYLGGSATAASPDNAPITTAQSASTPTAVVVQTAPRPRGQYADGTYTGAPADAYYGIVQTRAVIQSGKLAVVSFLQYPNDRSTSRYINDVAMPQLKAEAIQAQSAQVNAVSGASETSAAFRQSLGSALAQAKN